MNILKSERNEKMNHSLFISQFVVVMISIIPMRLQLIITMVKSLKYALKV